MIRTARQFHNQPEASHQHQFLADLWQDVRDRSGGRLDVAVHPRNGGVAGSDPRVLEMLVAGELEFATMMGPLIAHHVPAAEVQGLPFVFASSTQAHAAADGALGDHLRAEARARGLYLVPFGTLENGLRQVCSVKRPVRSVRDLAGFRIRVPNAAVIRALFEALGATPVTINIDQLPEALASGRIDGHENPLAITEANALHPVTRSIALTDHAWSGFNLVANLRFWDALAPDVQDIVHRAAKIHVARQRVWTMALNTRLASEFAGRGIEMIRPDRDSLRAAIGPAFYARWRDHVGATAWRLLAESVGGLPA